MASEARLRAMATGGAAQDEASVKLGRAKATIFVCLSLAPSLCEAAPKWTFCVAADPTGKDVWITEVFATSLDRGRLEGALESKLRKATDVRVIAQCPQASADKVGVVNAQTTAIAFNRALRSRLHPVSDFVGLRRR